MGSGIVLFTGAVAISRQNIALPIDDYRANGDLPASSGGTGLFQSLFHMRCESHGP